MAIPLFPRRTFFSALCTLLLFCSDGSAALLMQYPISESAGSDNPLSAINVDPNISASTLSVIGATPVVTGPGAGGFIASGWGNSLDSGKYFQFVITPQSGFEVAYSTLTYALIRTPDFTSLWQLHASTDGFVSSDITLASHDLTSSANASQVLFSDIDLSSVGSQAGAVTFRLYGWGDDFSGGFANSMANSGTGSDILLNGTVAPVPEPSYYGIVAALGALGVGLLRNSKRRGIAAGSP